MRRVVSDFTFIAVAVGECDDTFTVQPVVAEFALVAVAVREREYSVPGSLVVPIIPFIALAIGEDRYAPTVQFVVPDLAFVAVAVCEFDDSAAIGLVVLEIALVASSIGISEHAAAMASIVAEVPVIAVSVAECVNAAAVQPAVLEFAFDTVAVDEADHTRAIQLATPVFGVLTAVRISVLEPLQHALAVGKTLLARTGPRNRLTRTRVCVPHAAPGARIGDPGWFRRARQRGQREQDQARPGTDRHAETLTGKDIRVAYGDAIPVCDLRHLMPDQRLHGCAVRPTPTRPPAALECRSPCRHDKLAPACIR